MHVDSQFFEQRRFIFFARERRRRAAGNVGGGRPRSDGRLIQLGRMHIVVETLIIVGIRTSVEVEIVVGHKVRIVIRVVLILVHLVRSHGNRTEKKKQQLRERPLEDFLESIYTRVRRIDWKSKQQPLLICTVRDRVQRSRR